MPKIWRVDVKHDGRRRFSRRSSSRKRELARGVHVEVEQRIVHRVDVAHLPGEVEHDVGTDRGVADVGPVGRGEVGLHHRDATVAAR